MTAAAKKIRDDDVVEQIRPVDGGFERDANGRIKPTSQKNILHALERLGIELKYDCFRDRKQVVGLDGFVILDDAAVERMWLSVEREFRFLPTKDFFFTVVSDAARRNSVHPVREYLNALTWDGVPRIDRWLTTYGGAEDTPYIRAVGSLLLIAAVRRVRQPGCKYDELVVLESPQGTNKSSALAVLAVHPEWFSDDLPLNVDSKRVIEQLQGRWIIEAAELTGIRKTQVEHVKALLSRSSDRARMSYGRETTERDRQCVIVGTTNHAQYLRDLSGNRRFWPVSIRGFDLDALQRDRDQLWAEAAAREAGGASIRLDEKLWPKAAEEQRARTVEEPWMDRFHDKLGDMKGKLSAEDAWRIIGLPAGQRTQEHNSRLGQVMRALGWKRKKIRAGGKLQWGYARGGKKVEGRRICVVRSTADYADVDVHYEGDAPERRPY